MKEIVRSKSRGPFHMMPDVVEEILKDPFERSLFMTYARASGGSPIPLSIGIRHGVKESGVSKNRFIAVRDRLAAKGFIKIAKTPGNQPDIVEVLWDEIWDRNVKIFSTPEKIEESVFQSVAALPNDARQRILDMLINDESLSQKREDDTPKSDEIENSQSHKWDNDVPDMGENSPTNGITMSQIWDMHIYREEKEREEPNPADGGSPSGDAVENAGKRHDPYAGFNRPAPTPTSGEARKIKQTDIAGRALTQWLLELSGKNSLPAKVVNLLTQDKIVITDDEGLKHEYPTLVDLYDKAPGFKTFASARAKQFERMGEGKIDIGRFAAHLANLGKVDDKNNGSFHGWLKWREEHPLAVATYSENSEDRPTRIGPPLPPPTLE